MPTAASNATSTPAHALRVVVLGTYDVGKPRTRILLRGLQEAGATVIECHSNIWAGVEDKSRLGPGWRFIAIFLRLILAYPNLAWRYIRLPRHDVVLIPYLGHLDAILLLPFAWLRGVPVAWDAFISLYDTVVQDRRLVAPNHPLARLVWMIDWLACRASDLVLLDTHAHAAWFQSEFNIPHKTDAVLVGAEPEAFAPLSDVPEKTDGPVRILFYGQFINLHGIETIVHAASRADPDQYLWTIIGTGQEEPRLRRLVAEHRISNLNWIPWVNYDDLRTHIANADICLGIFGTSDKAARVIPNKVFQIIAAGRPLVTRDSPAIRELIGLGNPAVCLVPAGDPDALLRGIESLRIQTPEPSAAYHSLRQKISPASIGKRLLSLLNDVVGEKKQ